jgi:hypothetical protein
MESRGKEVETKKSSLKSEPAQFLPATVELSTPEKG